jgi:ABC-type oligopeptide transport system ATPase subunit
VQAQILALLADLQARLNLTYVFISHDLAVVESIASEVAVMQRGKIVERGSRSEIFANPRHDYTRLLLSSIPGFRRRSYGA